MMDFLYYVLKVCICSGLLFGYYWAALRNKQFHQWNRFYLLAAIILSIVVPLVHFHIAVQDDNQVITILNSVNSNEVFLVAHTKQPTKALTPEQLLAAGYGIVSVLFLVAASVFLFRLIKIISSHQRQRINAIHFVNTEVPGTPFSFFNYIIWNKNIPLESDSGRQIFQHELAHIKEGHSYDKVLCLLVLIPFWVNPFFWLMRKELTTIHEFIADKKSVGAAGTEAFAKMILQATYTDRFQIFGNPFFQSSIKRRLAMLTKEKNPKMNYLVRLMALLLVVVVIAAFTFKAETRLNQQKEAVLQKNILQNDTVKTSITSYPKEQIDKNQLANTPIADTTPTLKYNSNENYKGKNIKEMILVKNKIETYVLLKFEDGSKKRLSEEEAWKANIITYSFDRLAPPVNLKDTIPERLKEEVVQGYKLEEKTVDGPTFTKTEVEARYKGNWPDYLRKNLDPNVPAANNAPPGAYTVVVQFIVGKDGATSDFKALTNFGYGMEEEVLKVLKNSGDWEPAMQNGHKVRAYRKQPITFIIPKDDSVTTSNQQAHSIPTIKLSSLQNMKTAQLRGSINGYDIKSFTINVDDKNGGVISHKNEGITFDAITKKLIDGLKHGDFVTFESIRGIKDGEEKKFPAKIFQIE